MRFGNEVKKQILAFKEKKKIEGYHQPQGNFYYLKIKIEVYNWNKGENGQVPSLAKIISNLLLIVKYLAIYHFFKTRVWLYNSSSKNLSSIMVPVDMEFFNYKTTRGTRVWRTWVPCK